MESITPFLEFWRTTVSHDREIVDAVVKPDHRGPSDELEAALERWEGRYYWADGDRVDGRGDDTERLVLIRVLARPRSERWWLHSLLFALTFLTVLAAGARLEGVMVGLLPGFSGAPAELVADLTQWLGRMSPGLVFASALMGILLAHEMGHYVAARSYSINASPPYFLPAPWPGLFIGTLGAFIRIRSPIVDRRQLLDVGATGPWAGFVVALVCLVLGLRESSLLVGPPGPGGQLIMIGDIRLYLGDSILMYGLREWLAVGGPVVLNPLAFAGWVGLFVTTLNLMPLGQLDGGHVLYALAGERQRAIGWVSWLGLVVMGYYFKGWWLWAALTLLLGQGRLAHPSVLDRHRPIPADRHVYGWVTVFLFVVTFTPIPFVF